MCMHPQHIHIHEGRFERLVFAVNVRLKDTASLSLLADSYEMDRPATGALNRMAGAGRHTYTYIRA